MTHHSSTLTLAFALLAACATTAPSREVVPLPGPRPPPELELGSEHLMDAIAREVVIVPFTVAPELGSDGPLRASALAQLLSHAVENDHDLYPRGLAFEAGLYDTPAQALAALLKPRPALPPRLASSHIRFVLSGHLSATHLDLWLMDRDEEKLHRRKAPVDTPRLFAPRMALAALFADAGVPPSELQRADMSWYEDLSNDALSALGRALLAFHLDHGDPTTLIPQAERLAPMSYTVAVLSTLHAQRSAPSCSPELITRYTHMVGLHRSTPTFLSAAIIACEVQHALDGSVPLIPTWAKRSDATCRIAAKSLTAIGAGRGSLTGGNRIGQTFVTGLGGIYRGDTCEAGVAVNGLADESITPFARASLELEAAFYFYGDGMVAKSQRWFETARESASKGDSPHCLQQLVGAEATLGLADLAVESSVVDVATQHLAEAETTALRCDDRRMLGRVANSRGILAQGQSRLDEALTLFTKAYDHFAALGDEMNLAVAKTNLGVTWLHLGQHDKAIALLEEALLGKERVRSRGGIAVLHENLGVAELARGNADAAEGHFTRSLEVATDPQTLATLHVQIARLALSRGDNAKASHHMDEADKLSKKVHARVLRAVIEQVKGAVASDEGRFTDALADFHSALAIRRSLGDRMGEGITLTLLMQVAIQMKEPALAILYGKLAVAAHEEVRKSAQSIDRETGRQFVASRAQSYRALADLLIQEGRLIEAERVLALLKEDEAREWTREAKAASTSGGVPLTTAERTLDERYRKVADRVMELGREHTELAAKADITTADKLRLDALRKDLEAANAAFLGFLQTLGAEGGKLATHKTLDSLREDAGIGPDLVDLGPGHVAVYTLIAEKALHLIVVSADAQTARSVPIDAFILDNLVVSFRDALQDPTSDPLPIAKELYSLLIAPIEKDLIGARATHVLWSLDRTLRYLPIGALHDGKRYAIERWSHSIFTPASHARLKDLPVDWRVLALGVTRGHPPFTPLPGVADELKSIVAGKTTKGVLPGFLALDADFTRDRLLTELGRRWPVVHLASHFSFMPGDKDNSFLLLGDGGRLSVTELERLPNLFSGVDLLTLSACNTATGDNPGDGTEVESFAVLAQRKGARAVFASLWPVADASTSWLMGRFYGAKKTTKTRALRQAQVDMLHNRANPGWRHPYHWAPFVIIGNTR